MTFYSRSCGSKTPTTSAGPCGPTGYPHSYGSPLNIVGNTGSASPDSSGQVTISGVSGITTSGTGMNMTINNLRDVSEYVVGPSGEAEYSTLDDAIRAASSDPKTDPNDASVDGVSIILLPGTYTLTDSLNTDRRINFVANSFNGSPSVKIIGQGQSAGNKTWSNVNFSDPVGLYSLKNNKVGKTTLTDNFCKCHFTCDFKTTTDNHNLNFDQCFMNYNNTTRDSVLEVDGGQGFLSLTNCKLVCCRLGTPKAPRFIRLNSNTLDTTSSFINCQFTYGIEGSDDHVGISIENTQPVLSSGCLFDYASAIPNRCFAFGIHPGPPCAAPCPNHPVLDCQCMPPPPPLTQYPNPNAKLDVYHTDFRSKTGQNLASVGNLWSGTEQNAIRFHHCTVDAAWAIRNDLSTVTNGQIGGWNYHKSVIQSPNTTNPLFYTLANSNTKVQMRLNSNTISSSYPKNPNAMPTPENNPFHQFRFEQNGITNTADMIMLGNLMLDNSGNNPPWLNNATLTLPGFDTVNVKNNSNGRDQLDVAGQPVNSFIIPPNLT